MWIDFFDLIYFKQANWRFRFIFSTRMGHIEVVKSILTKDPSVCFKIDKKGQTTLHVAVKGQNVDIVMELLKPDPSIINLKDGKGETEDEPYTQEDGNDLE
ncbi:hypothetical protein Taro_040329 [Colocasia esculenta]|uniref:Uncharacterized protein n=1 Tax=Colocasia esculenta TaxID=4460 RepID=A0A843WSQ3_COLES|nr:hypothetical protein [Colocasia esculenta]